MNVVWRIVVSLSVLSLLMSCASKAPGEEKGDIAYKLSKKTQGDQKRTSLKTAYIYYDRAIKAKGAKISPTLRNRYIEVTLIRAGMVLNEGAAHMEAIPLFMADLDKFNNEEVTPDLKQQYAMFVLQLADSSIAKERYDDALDFIKKAGSVASDITPVNKKRSDLTSRIAQENYETADMEYNNGKLNKDAEDYVKAEFYALTALYFDSTHAASKKLLKDLRKENLATYSAYLRVIDPIPDSTIFRKINKWDILLALPVFQKKGGSITAIIDIYNNSYGYLKLKAEQFSLIDVNGKKYPAKASRIDPEILDQEHEAKVKLTFQTPAADIAQLEYRNGDHYSVKFFQ